MFWYLLIVGLLCKKLQLLTWLIDTAVDTLYWPVFCFHVDKHASKNFFCSSVILVIHIWVLKFLGFWKTYDLTNHHAMNKINFWILCYFSNWQNLNMLITNNRCFSLPVRLIHIGGLILWPFSRKDWRKDCLKFLNQLYEVFKL